jgi:glycogen operon protein
MYGYRVNSPRADLSLDRRDSAPGVTKERGRRRLQLGRRPAAPRAVVRHRHLRGHLKGLTFLRSDLRPRERGTFAALADPATIDHLRRLGVTAVELMPIHAFLQDRHLLQQGLRNYWGYNTLTYFAIEPRYLSTAPPTTCASPCAACMPPASS